MKFLILIHDQFVLNATKVPFGIRPTAKVVHLLTLNVQNATTRSHVFNVQADICFKIITNLVENLL